jgi:hypothetical protein
MGGVAAAEGGPAVGVDIEGLVGAGAAWEGILADSRVLDVRARGPGIEGVGVVEHPLEVVEVGDAK